MNDEYLKLQFLEHFLEEILPKEWIFLRCKKEDSIIIDHSIHGDTSSRIQDALFRSEYLQYTKCRLMKQ